MTNIIKLIITLTLFFSSLTNTFAKEGYIEKLFDLNYGIEEINLNLKSINYITFNQNKYNRVFNKIKTIDSILKKELMRNYREGKYEYYKMNGIITNYNNFVYHTNMFLSFLKIKEKHNNYSEINTAIITSYTSIKESYNKFKKQIK